MQFFNIDAPGGAKRSLSKILREKFGIEEEVERVYRMGDGGVNDAGNGHLVAETTSGRRFGLKTKARGAGAADGARREVAYWAACQAIGFSRGCRAVSVQKIPGLAGFEEETSAITEWVQDSKRVSEITPEEKTEIEAEVEILISQVAHWVAINLHFGLTDRGGLKNWVWCHAQRRLVAVDTESAWGNNASVQDHHPIIATFYGCAKLKQERGTSKVAMAFEATLRQMHSTIRTQIGVIVEVTKDISSANHYSSPFASHDEQAFADYVFSLLA